jgi:hypothetical protein
VGPVSGGPVILAIIGAVLVVASLAVVARAGLHPGAYVVRRDAEGHAPLLTATLTRSHRELPGGPSAASTARPVYRITDLPGHEARASKER